MSDEDNTLDELGQEAPAQVEKTEGTTGIDKQAKGKDVKKDKNIGERLTGVVREYRGEFNKIVWPSREQLLKQTVTVLLTSLIFAVIITGMDTVFGYGLKFIGGLGGLLRKD